MAQALKAFGLQADPATTEADAPEPDVRNVCEVWPEHVDALHLLLACLGQLQQLIGGMGGAVWRAAQAVNVAQEARWLGLAGQRQAVVVRQYRVMEAEALRTLNEREAQARARARARKR